MNETNRLPRPSPIWPPLLLLLAGVLMVGVALIAAERQNDLERERSRVRVAAALQTLSEASGATARDYGVWDEGVANLVVSLDPDWADKNIGSWLFKYGGVSRSLVVAPDNSVPYAFVDGARTSARLDSAGLVGLTERARAAARDDRPEVVGLAMLDGRLVLGAAVAIRAEDTEAVTDPISVLLLVQDFSGYILPKLAETVGLPNLSVDPPGPARRPAALPLREGSAAILGQLAWAPPKPGSEFLELSLPASLAAFAIIAALAIVLWRGLHGAFARLHRAYEEIAVSQHRQQVFLGASPDTWLRLDAGGVVLDYIGPRDGLTEQPIRPGDRIDQVMPEEIAERLRQATRIALFCGTLERFDFALGVPPRWFEARVVRLDQGQVVLTASDVTARKTAEELLVRQAHYDTLTGLPNRVLAIDRLAQAMSRADRGSTHVGVVILDLVNFKAVNDTWGHGAGDMLLVEAGARLSAVMRKSDTVGRLEGDEFLLVLPDIDSDEAVDRVVEKALQALRRPTAIAGHEVFLSALAGVCSYPADGATTADLLKNADTALYSAKRDGHSGARRFHRAMTDSLRLRTMIETRLQRALSAGELSLHYQPLFDLRQGRITGAEALLRWNPTDMDPVGPQHFIPVAEATGLIVDIGRWVLDEACRTAAGWRSQAGKDFRIAVNLSPRQFRQDIVADVAGALRLSGLPPEALELEITEGLLVNEDQAKALFTLHDMGVRLSIDDFGTGFSSLGYLRRFPFHTLKVDRSFVSNVTADGGDATLTLTIVTMARSLGLSTIGEGVETPEQLSFLRDCGCDEIQGYLISRPVPPRQFRDLLESGVAVPAA
jgi:diguanylate cyclase (GGDEF)-like protein